MSMLAINGLEKVFDSQKGPVVGAAGGGATNPPWSVMARVLSRNSCVVGKAIA